MRAYFLSKKGLVVILRWLLFFVAAYLVASGEGRGFTWFIALLVLFAASNVALIFVSPENFRRWRLNFLVVVFDMAFISGAIFFTGDLDLYIFYFFTILMASYGRQIQGSLLAAALASGFYIWMAVRQGNIHTLLSPSLLIRLPFFYLVALISSFMAEESREEEERVGWTQVILGMTQEMGLARDQEGIFSVMRSTLRRFPGVVDVGVYFQRGELYMAAAGNTPSGGRPSAGWTREALGLGPGPEKAEAYVIVAVRPVPGGPHPRAARSLAAFSFELRSGARGLLLVYASGLEGFRERICEIFGIAVLSLARSLENLESFHEIQRRAAEIASLMNVNQVINSTLDLREVLQKVMALSTQIIGVEASSLMLIEESTRELVFEVATGEKGEKVKQIRLKIGEGVAGWVAREGKPIIVNDAPSDPRFFARVDLQTGFSTRNLMAVPLTVRGRVIGVLEVINKIPAGPFGEENMKLLQALADQAGTAIEKARLYAYMEEQVNETIEMYLSLEKEKSKIETIVASMIEGVMVSDEAGEVILMNGNARKSLSRDGTTWLPEYGRILELLRLAARERREFSETIAPDLPGHHIFRVRVAPMRTAAGKFLGAVAVLEDVTELTRLSEMKSQFISEVSHELRTPLTSMRGAMNLLLRGRAGPLAAGQIELTTMVQEEIGRMTGLINDLLDLSKLESGLVRLEPETVAVEALAARLVEGMRVLLGEKNIRLEWEFAPELGPVRADRKCIERVFANLVGNAIKYSPVGSVIAVGGTARDALDAGGAGGAGPTPARFWVRDNGPGIAPEDQKRIFERFQRGKSVEGVAGTGLGLAIARGIVEEHGGQIWVESRPGEGSTFFFTLPLATDRERQNRTGGSPEEGEADGA